MGNSRSHPPVIMTDMNLCVFCRRETILLPPLQPSLCRPFQPASSPPNPLWSEEVPVCKLLQDLLQDLTVSQAPRSRMPAVLTAFKLQYCRVSLLQNTLLSYCWLNISSVAAVWCWTISNDPLGSLHHLVCGSQNLMPEQLNKCCVTWCLFDVMTARGSLIKLCINICNFLSETICLVTKCMYTN